MLLLKIFHVLGQLSMDVFRQNSDVRKEGSKHGQLFLEQLHLLLEPLVLPRQNLDSLLRFSRPHLGLLARLPDGDVVSLATFSVLVRVSVHSLFGARTAVGRVRLEITGRYCERLEGRERSLARSRGPGSGYNSSSGVHVAVHDESCHRVRRAANCAVGILLVVVGNVLLVIVVVVRRDVVHGSEEAAASVPPSSEVISEFIFYRLLLYNRRLLLLLLLHVISESCSAVNRSGQVSQISILKVWRRFLTTSRTRLAGRSERVSGRCSVGAVALLPAVDQVSEEVVVAEVRVVDQTLEIERDLGRAELREFCYVARTQFRILEMLFHSEGCDGGGGLDG